MKKVEIKKYLGKAKKLLPLTILISMINGAVMPVFGYIFAKVLGILL